MSMMIKEVFFVRDFVVWTGDSEFRFGVDFTIDLILVADGLLPSWRGAPCLGSKGESTRAADSTCG